MEHDLPKGWSKRPSKSRPGRQVYSYGKYHHQYDVPTTTDIEKAKKKRQAAKEKKVKEEEARSAQKAKKKEEAERKKVEKDEKDRKRKEEKAKKAKKAEEKAKAAKAAKAAKEEAEKAKKAKKAGKKAKAAKDAKQTAAKITPAVNASRNTSKSTDIYTISSSDSDLSIPSSSGLHDWEDLGPKNYPKHDYADSNGNVHIHFHNKHQFFIFSKPGSRPGSKDGKRAERCKTSKEKRHSPLGIPPKARKGYTIGFSETVQRWYEVSLESSDKYRYFKKNEIKPAEKTKSSDISSKNLGDSGIAGGGNGAVSKKGSITTSRAESGTNDCRKRTGGEAGLRTDDGGKEKKGRSSDSGSTAASNTDSASVEPPSKPIASDPVEEAIEQYQNIKREKVESVRRLRESGNAEAWSDADDEFNKEYLLTSNAPWDTLSCRSDDKPAAASTYSGSDVLVIGLTDEELAQKKKEVFDSTGKKINPEALPSLNGTEPAILHSVMSTELIGRRNIRFEDVAGLDDAKEAFHDAALLPLMEKDLSLGNLLFYGQPGVGKTYIVQAIANVINAPVLNVSAADIDSKYYGDQEKLIKALFAYAEHLATLPKDYLGKEERAAIVIMFIDEIESILVKRSDRETDHKRSGKNMFLIELEGVQERTGNVVLIGATNRPYDIDPAFIRRFAVRKLIQMPDEKARATLMLNSLKSLQHDISINDLKQMVAISKGYSGSDLRHVFQKAIQLNMKREEAINAGPEQRIPWTDNRTEDGRCFLKKRKVAIFTKTLPFDIAIFKEAFRLIKPAVDKTELGRLEAWDRTYGT